MWGGFNWIKIFKAKIWSKVENFKSSMSQCSEESVLQELGTIWKSFKCLLSYQSESWRIISNKFGFFNLFVYGTLTFTGTSRRRLVEIMRSRKNVISSQLWFLRRKLEKKNCVCLDQGLRSGGHQLKSGNSEQWRLKNLKWMKCFKSICQNVFFLMAKLLSAENSWGIFGPNWKETNGKNWGPMSIKNLFWSKAKILIGWVKFRPIF